MKTGFHTSLQLAYNLFRNMATLQIVHKTFKCDRQLFGGNYCKKFFKQTAVALIII